ncbi:MAG: hypothetical protein R3B83_01350 [Nitrospirales bacterium]|nr:hypothetical protein [Nitrospirales bacterium]HQU28367.1 hypothetical protein [Nitrospirales bacterium]
MSNLSDVTFHALWTHWPWKAIRHCPGRFLLPLRGKPLSFAELTGQPCTPIRYESSNAPDPVWVLPLIDGGLIAYQQTDGRLLHTLNTPEGFIRKLTQLGIMAHGAMAQP